MAQLLHTTRFTAPSPVQASFAVTIPATQPGSTLIVPAGGGAVITLQLGVAGPTFTKRTRSLAGMEIACQDIVDTVGGTTTITVTLNGPETVDGMIFEFAAGSVGAYIGGATEPGGAGASTNSYGNVPTGPITTATPSLYFSMFGATNNPNSAPAYQYWGLEPLGKQFVNAYNTATNGPTKYWSMIGLSSLASAGTYTGNSSSMTSTYQAGSWAYEDLRPDLPAYANPYKNALEAENSLPGSTKAAWALASVDPNIAGYTDSVTYSPGGTVNFKVDSQGGGFTVDIFRVGAYNYAQFMARHKATVTGAPATQPTPTIDSYGGTVCSWSTTASWTIPADAVPGVYRFNMIRSDNAGYAASGLFVVKSPKPAGKSSQIMVTTTEFTWQAYNAWGGILDYGGINTFSGRSVYAHAPTANSFSDRAFAVSFDRPLGTGSSNPTTYFWDGEVSLINFLEMNGYDVAYYSSTDLDIDPTIPSHYQVAVSHGHSEYWTDNLRNAYENARDAGTHLVFISGNTSLWRVRFDPTDMNRRRMICYKDSADTTGWDGVTKYDPVSYTGTWRDMRTTPGGVNNTARRPESGMTGQWFIGNGTYNDTLAISTDFASLPIWRNTVLPTITGITFRGAASGTLAAAATSITLTTPASMQVGDLIVFALVFNNTPGDVYFGYSGFRPVRIIRTNNQSMAVGTYYAKAAGAQAVTITWATSTLASAALSVYGNAVVQDTGSSMQLDTSGDALHTTAAITVPAASRWAISVFGDTTTSNATATTTWTPGTGLTLRGAASGSANVTGPWSSIALMDTNGAAGVGVHSYSATADFANAYASTALLYIAPGNAARMMTIGAEWDYVKRDEPSTPTNLVRLSAQALPLGAQAAAYNGDTYLLNGMYRYGLSLYRANSGALVFNAGSWRFSYGLSRFRNGDLNLNDPVDPMLQQATINLLGDMGITPGTLMNAVQNNDTTLLVGPGAPASAADYGLVLAPVNYQTIFQADQEPTNRNAADGNAYTLSTVFSSTSSGAVHGVRWYFPDTLPSEEVIGLLYSWSGSGPGAELARVNFTNPQTGWCEAVFDSPVQITANTNYVVAVWTSDAFPITKSVFATSGVTNGANLTAPQDSTGVHNGSFVVSASPTYPTSSYASSAYYVDVLFVADSGSARLSGWGIPIN